METELSRVVSPAPRSAWHALVEGDPASTLCSSPQWIDALTNYAHWSDASRYYETTDGRAFVLPLVRRGPRTVAGLYASLPSGWGMGGFASSDAMRSSDVTAVLADVRELNPLGVRILPNPLRGEAWSRSDSRHSIALDRYAHVLPLERAYETIWTRSFHRSARQNVRKAMRSDLTIERDTTGRFIPVYRELFRQSIQRWADHSGEPQWLARARGYREDLPGKLEFLAEALGEKMVTWIAWHRGEPAASLITLRGTSVLAWRSAMNEELGRTTCAGHLLHHHAIEEACADGAANYHFGESGNSCGVSTFKERFGAIGLRYHEVRCENVPYTRTNLLARSAVKRLVRYHPG